MLFVAGPKGFEPSIFPVTGGRVNRATPRTHGGWGGFRTHYLGLMSPTLYRLSYPAVIAFGLRLSYSVNIITYVFYFLVAGVGLEPTISRL